VFCIPLRIWKGRRGCQPKSPCCIDHSPMDHGNQTENEVSIEQERNAHLKSDCAFPYAQPHSNVTHYERDAVPTFQPQAMTGSLKARGPRKGALVKTHPEDCHAQLNAAQTAHFAAGLEKRHSQRTHLAPMTPCPKHKASGCSRPRNKHDQKGRTP